MSCLRIHLPPAKKAWKFFTSKIQTKLPNLHKSKNKRITPKHLVPAKTSKSSGPSSLILLGKRFKRKRRRAVLSQHILKAKTEPIYIDQLFKDHVPELVVDIPSSKRTKLVSSVEGVRISDGPDRKEGAKVVNQIEEAAPGTSAGGSEESLESIRLASPLMQSIDERAEAFITRFRAEMELQEIIARNL